jgi:exodeoxyribonuclease VII small subunit
MSEKTPPSFEEQINRLEAIVSQLEHGEVQLADSLTLFEEGTKLITSCGKMLDQAEQTVVKLMKGADGTPVEQPFEDSEN